MLEAAKLIIEFTQARTFQELLTDALLRSAVERQFEILGEASSHVSADTQALWPSIEWKQIKNFRNLLAHEYFRTNYAEVWNIARNLLPPLLPTLEALFADLDRQFGPDVSI
ncbi:HepT-like ribonuclease domain-containing protein [Hymenobacter ruber]